LHKNFLVMKARLLLFGLMLSVSFLAIAQEKSSEPGYKTPFKHNKAADNWFIHLGLGAQVYFGDNDNDADFLDRPSLAPVLAVGKWFSPYWGARLKVQGGDAHGFEDDGAYMQHNRYYNVHLDAMWNLANYWGVYSPEKCFSFSPYIGLGYAHRFQKDSGTGYPQSLGYPTPYVDPSGNRIKVNDWLRYADALSVNAGIEFGFALSKRINLDFDFGAQVLPDYFDRYSARSEYEAIASATAGITFKLGKTDFEEVSLDYGLIDDLNRKINNLRAENEQLAKRPVSCPECPDAAPVINEQINYVPNVVFFRINSAKIDANQKVSIFNTAEFVNSTGEKIKVTGYADKKTGTAQYNLKLSEQRAKAVAKELTTKYNVPSDKIVVEWKGSDAQPYKENVWNRIVVMSSDKK